LKIKLNQIEELREVGEDIYIMYIAEEKMSSGEIRSL